MPSYKKTTTSPHTKNNKHKTTYTNCDRFRNLKHSIHLPYAFTEQGVTQLSAVLRSDIAVEMSVRINDAFHAMRRFIMNNAAIFQRLEAVELKQLSTDNKINDDLRVYDFEVVDATYSFLLIAKALKSQGVNNENIDWWIENENNNRFNYIEIE